MASRYTLLALGLVWIVTATAGPVGGKDQDEPEKRTATASRKSTASDDEVRAWQQAAKSAALHGRRAAVEVIGKLNKLTRNRTAGVQLVSPEKDLKLRIVEISLEGDTARARVRVSGMAKIGCQSVTDTPREITAEGRITVELRLELTQTALPAGSFESPVVRDYELKGSTLFITEPRDVREAGERASLIERVEDDLEFAAVQQKESRLESINSALSRKPEPKS